MEEKTQTFEEKLEELLAMAKKKKNVLEYQEISDFFADMELDPDKFEQHLWIFWKPTMWTCFGSRDEWDDPTLFFWMMMTTWIWSRI